MSDLLGMLTATRDALRAGAQMRWLSGIRRAVAVNDNKPEVKK